MRKILVVFSDTHGGHRLGLMNPHVTLYDEDEHGNLTPYTPRSTATQKYLWKMYRADIRRVKKLAAGDPIVLFHNGDLTQGNRHPAHLVSTRMADPILIAKANMVPWLDWPNMVWPMLVVSGSTIPTTDHRRASGCGRRAINCAIISRA